MRRTLALLATALLLPLAPFAGAVNPLDDDAGSGGDAGDAATDALAVPPGRIVGDVVNGADRSDFYAFSVAAGEAVRVDVVGMRSAVSTGDGASVLLRSPTGEAHPPGRYVAPAEPGSWRAEVRLAPGASAVRYAFDLLVFEPPPQDDAGSGRDATLGDPVVLADGASTGRLDAYDAEDVYAIEAVSGALVDVVVEVDGPWPGGLHVSASNTPYAVRDGSRWSVRALVPEAKTMYVRVVDLKLLDGAAQVDYVVTVERRDAFGGVSLEDVPRARDLGAPARAVALGAAGGLDAISPEGLWHHDGAGAKLVRKDVRGDHAAGRDDAGRLYYLTGHGVMERFGGRDAPEPFALASERSFAFAPSGEVFVAYGPRVARVAPDGGRVEYARLPDLVSDLAFAPDGTLYALTVREGAVRRVEEGASTVVAEVGGGGLALAFDGEGRGYVPVGGALLRFDATGATTLVARAAGRDMVVGEGMVYLATGMLVGVPVDASSFAGFRPSLGGPRVPDLVVDVEVAEPTQPYTKARDVTVTIENRGAAAAPTTGVEVYACGRDPGGDDPSWPCRGVRAHGVGAAYDDALRPGESRTYTFRWNPTSLAVTPREGDVLVEARVSGDPLHENNVDVAETCVRVCGTGVGV